MDSILVATSNISKDTLGRRCLKNGPSDYCEED